MCATFETGFLRFPIRNEEMSYRGFLFVTGLTVCNQEKILWIRRLFQCETDEKENKETWLLPKSIYIKRPFQKACYVFSFGMTWNRQSGFCVATLEFFNNVSGILLKGREKIWQWKVALSCWKRKSWDLLERREMFLQNLLSFLN